MVVVVCVGCAVGCCFVTRFLQVTYTCAFFFYICAVFLGTLQVLQDSGMDMSAYELSHVTYFPNLLFQAIHAHLGL